jgi:hypothetical protein
VPRFRLTTPFHRAWSTVAVAAVAFGVISALPAGGVVDASAHGATARAIPVRLLAHDVSHAIARQPRVHAHVTRRRMDVSAVIISPLARLLPKPKRTLASASHALAPVTIGSFEGTAGPGGYNPGDPNGDIGLTQYVQAVNLRLAVFSRAAPHTTLARLTNAQFWSGLSGPDGGGLCATSPSGDPSVQYDRLADRWVYSEFAFAVDGTGSPVAPFVQCVAVSSSPDATGTWYRYAFQVSTTKFPDYPKLGVWSDGYYLSYNQFDLTTGAFAGAGALALERSKMLTGSAAQARYFDLQSVNPGLGGMLPATMEGTNLPPVAPAGAADELYLQSLDDPNDANDRLQMWAFHVDWSAPVTGSHFYPVADLPVNIFSSAFGCADSNGALTTDCILQPQTTLMLDEVAAVVQGGGIVIPQLMYHLDYVRDLGGTQHLVATQTVNVGSNHAAVRWYELRNGAGTWSVGAQGTYAPDSDSRFMSSGGIDNSGELAIAYSITSSTTYPSLSYTGRLPGDPAGSMSIAETSLYAGSVSQIDSNRWGDYSSLSLDPIDLCTFWYTGQYVGAATGGNWRTRIGAFNFSTCVPRSPTPPLLTADPTWSTPIVREGQTITRAAGTFSGAVSATYQWRRCDRYGLSCIDIPGETALTHVFTAADAAGDRTVRLQETVTNATGTVVAASTATPVVQSLVPVNTVRPVITGTAQAGQTLTTTTGTWVSSSPMSYTYRWRLCTPTCAFIAGATSASYVVSPADVGSTIDVIVSGTNTGGGTDANADPTGIVQAAPPAPVTPPSGGGGSGGSSGGSSGGGGGTGGALDLAVTGYQNPANPQPGDNVTYVLSVDDLTPNQLAQSVYLNVTLPGGVSLLTTYADRGSGCIVLSVTQLRCYLDFLSGQAPHANVLITAKVTAAGTQVLVATVTAQQSESSLTNNTLTLTYTSGSGTTSPPTVPGGLNGDGTPTVTQDTRKPTVHALLTSAKRGAVAKLRFKIYDDHGIAKAITTVKRGTTNVGKASTGFGPVVFGSVYYVGWRVPAKAAKGMYTFCVTAVDRAGNKSARACAPVALR